MKRLAIRVCALVFCSGFCSKASAQAGIITTVAGNGNTLISSGASGDGGPATSARLVPTSVVVDASGTLFIADEFKGGVRKVSASGIITTVAGNGTSLATVGVQNVTGVLGDGGPATSASIIEPQGVAMDVFGSLFVSDRFNDRVRKVSAGGIITTVAGGSFIFGDGGPATAASFIQLSGVAVDASGNLFIADTNNDRIRKVSANGTITTVAGCSPCSVDPSATDLFGDGGLATSAPVPNPSGIAMDASGNLFIAADDLIRKVSPGGTITTVAGNINGFPGFSGDGGPATSASLNNSTGCRCGRFRKSLHRGHQQQPSPEGIG